jgi:hypothetical protein
MSMSFCLTAVSSYSQRVKAERLVSHYTVGFRTPNFCVPCNRHISGCTYVWWEYKICVAWVCGLNQADPLYLTNIKYYIILFQVLLEITYDEIERIGEERDRDRGYTF